MNVKDKRVDQYYIFWLIDKQ